MLLTKCKGTASLTLLNKRNKVNIKYWFSSVGLLSNTCAKLIEQLLL
jgi:hypothetical protein